ncbi:MAG: hypothetical protein ABI216_10525 [Devosia sp.]
MTIFVDRIDGVIIPAAVCLCAMLLGLGAFQLLLAAGAPIGHFAWGGQHRVLPVRLRVGSIVSTVLYAVFAIVVLTRAGVFSVLPYQVAQVGIWVIAGLLLLGAIPNLISRSTPERYLMAPLALMLFALCVVVALG